MRPQVANPEPYEKALEEAGLLKKIDLSSLGLQEVPFKVVMSFSDAFGVTKTSFFDYYLSTFGLFELEREVFEKHGFDNWVQRRILEFLSETGKHFTKEKIYISWPAEDETKSSFYKEGVLTKYFSSHRYSVPIEDINEKRAREILEDHLKRAFELGRGSLAFKGLYLDSTVDFSTSLPNNHSIKKSLEEATDFVSSFQEHLSKIGSKEEVEIEKAMKNWMLYEMLNKSFSEPEKLVLKEEEELEIRLNCRVSWRLIPAVPQEPVPGESLVFGFESTTKVKQETYWSGEDKPEIQGELESESRFVVLLEYVGKEIESVTEAGSDKKEKGYVAKGKIILKPILAFMHSSFLKSSELEKSLSEKHSSTSKGSAKKVVIEVSSDRRELAFGSTDRAKNLNIISTGISLFPARQISFKSFIEDLVRISKRFREPPELESLGGPFLDFLYKVYLASKSYFPLLLDFCIGGKEVNLFDVEPFKSLFSGYQISDGSFGQHSLSPVEDFLGVPRGYLQGMVEELLSPVERALARFSSTSPSKEEEEREVRVVPVGFYSHGDESFNGQVKNVLHGGKVFLPLFIFNSHFLRPNLYASYVDYDEERNDFELQSSSFSYKVGTGFDIKVTTPRS